MMIEHALTKRRLGFTRRTGTDVWIPYIRAAVSIPGSNKGANLSQPFLVDTGAAITVLNKYWSPLFEDVSPIDYQQLQFGGGGIKKLPVYQANISIQGHTFGTEVVLHVDLPLKESLLGWHRCLGEQFAFMYFRTISNTKPLKFRLLSTQQERKHGLSIK